MYSNRAQFDTIRSAAHTSIGATYATIGTVLGTPAVAVNLQNQTNGDVYISLDGTNDHLLFPANSYQVWDIRTNSQYLGDYLLSEGTQFYVKDGPTAPTSGTFWIEVLSLRVSTAL